MERSRKATILYLELQKQLTEHVRGVLKRLYDAELPRIVIDQPPDIKLGEYALPLSFELAKKLRKPPRKIAAITSVDTVAVGTPKMFNAVKGVPPMA